MIKCGILREERDVRVGVEFVMGIYCIVWSCELEQEIPLLIVASVVLALTTARNWCKMLPFCSASSSLKWQISVELV